MSTEATTPKEHYLSGGWDLQSWLLTTDHKRIGILYLVSITLMFALGSFYAALVRWNLLVPDGSHMSAETYNKSFTGHGVIMVFFFLIPSIPAMLGNFLIPLMIGAKDLAFPKLNLLSWYVYMIGRRDHALRAPRRRARDRLDLLHALLAPSSRRATWRSRRSASSSPASPRSSPGSTSSSPSTRCGPRA